MKSLGIVLPFVALAAISWGVYGPVLHAGQARMGEFETGQLSMLRPFICVGIAYFVIAVVLPVFLLRANGEKGHWTAAGFIWSFSAGIAGAVGALGIILAFKFRGNPVYVMPLVFGCAPVVNTIVTMLLARSIRQASMIFYFGVLVVAVGAAGVLVFKPSVNSQEELSSLYPSVTVDESDDGRIQIIAVDVDDNKREWDLSNYRALRQDDQQEAFQLYQLARERQQRPNFAQWILILLSIGLTAACWGAYGPVLHKGQTQMAGSRLRPLMCVGLAYFVIAVISPIVLMPAFPAEPGGWNVGGVLWSLVAGIAGAFGALGIIYAFNFGGKPVFVMPLVFGCAPVINTMTSLVEQWWTYNAMGRISPAFALSLVLVISGAITVLVFAPKQNSVVNKESPNADPPNDSTTDDDPAQVNDAEGPIQSNPTRESEKASTTTNDDNESNET